jgi:hypothetical protein
MEGTNNFKLIKNDKQPSRACFSFGAPTALNEGVRLFQRVPMDALAGAVEDDTSTTQHES